MITKPAFIDFRVDIVAGVDRNGFITACAVIAISGRIIYQIWGAVIGGVARVREGNAVRRRWIFGRKGVDTSIVNVHVVIGITDIMCREESGL